MLVVIMNKKYKDRGIIKWAPFDGLAGFNNLYEELKKSLEKLNKIELEENKLEEFDVTLKQALKKSLSILITYHFEDKNHQVEGFVRKVCLIDKKIVLEPFKVINLKDIIDLKIL